MSDEFSTQGTGRQRTVGLHQGAKSLLRNVMRHTDSHNKHVEESEMWQMYYRMKGVEPNDTDGNASKKKTAKVERSRNGRGYSSDDGGIGFREPDIQNSFLYDDRRDMRWEGGSRRGIKRAHMDDSSDEDRRNTTASSKSTFWMRQLHKAEETDPDRWGHAGFKELYPEVYDSDRSVMSDSSNRKIAKKKKKHSKKRHKHKGLTKKKKQKRDDSEFVKKKKKKRKSYRDESDKERRKKIKRQKSNDNSDIDNSSDSSRIDRRGEETRNSVEINESDKDSEGESERKRGRRNMKTESEREKKIEREVSVDRKKKKRRK